MSVRLRRGLTATMVGSFGERAIALAGLLILARVLPPQVVGSFVYVAAVVTLICSLLNVGASWTLMATQVVGSTSVSAHTLIQVVPGVSVIVAAQLGRRVVEEFGLDPGLITVAAAALAIAGVGSTSRLLLEREFRFQGIAVVTLVAAAISVIVGLMLAIRGAGVWAMALGAGPPSLVGALIQTAGYLALRPIWRDLLHWDGGEVMRFLRAGRTLWLGNQAVSLAAQLANILIGAVLGPGALGIFDRAFRLVQSAVAVLSQSAGRVALSLYARASRIDPSAGVIAHRLIALILMRLCLPGVVVLGVAAPDLVQELLGSQWAATAGVLSLLGPYLVFRVLDENLLAQLLGTGQNRTRVGGWIVVALAGIPLVPLGIWLAGVRGAAVAVGVGMALGWAFQQFMSDRTGMRTIAIASVRPAAAALGSGVAGDLAAQIHIAVVARLPIEVGIILVAYVALLAAFDRRVLIEFKTLNKQLHHIGA